MPPSAIPDATQRDVPLSPLRSPLCVFLARYQAPILWTLLLGEMKFPRGDIQKVIAGSLIHQRTHVIPSWRPSPPSTQDSATKLGGGGWCCSKACMCFFIPSVHHSSDSSYLSPWPQMLFPNCFPHSLKELKSSCDLKTSGLKGGSVQRPSLAHDWAFTLSPWKVNAYTRVSCGKE